MFGNENNYFIAYKDLSPGNQFSGGMVDEMNYPYDAVLINKTENGIGMIFLDHDGIVLNHVLGFQKGNSLCTPLLASQ